MLGNLLAVPGMTQLDGRAELRLQEMADTRAAQAEIVGRMRAVLTILADTFSCTRDQAMVEHHRTSTTIHSSFGTLVQAAIDTGLKVHLCEAGKPDYVGDDWLFVWYDPPADMRAIASPEEVRHASNPITQTNPFANAGSIQPFWIDVPPEPEFTMMFGRPIPAGFMDCHAHLDAPTVGMALN